MSSPARSSTGRRAGWSATLVPVLVLAPCVVALTLLVWIDGGAAALHVDRPVERWVVDHRTPAATSFFRLATNLGSPVVVFVGGLVLAVAAAVRSRRTALVIVVITLLRPLVSTAVKDLVGRTRPQLSQLVVARGGSYPSGHALGAAVFWGSVVAVAVVWRQARSIVRLAAVLAVVMWSVVACSRVYLGVHWLTDVIGGALLGMLLLVPLYRGPVAAVPTMDP